MRTLAHTFLSAQLAVSKAMIHAWISAPSFCITIKYGVVRMIQALS